VGALPSAPSACQPLWRGAGHPPDWTQHPGGPEMPHANAARV